jgi:hypothetical protein
MIGVHSPQSGRPHLGPCSRRNARSSDLFSLLRWAFAALLLGSRRPEQP